MKIEKISIKGHKLENPVYDSSDESWSLQSSYVITGTVRGSVENHPEDLSSDNTVVQLILEDDTTWLCSNQTLDELFPEAISQKRSADNIFEIPSSISASTMADRSLLSNIAIKVINIFIKKGVPLAVHAAADRLETKQLNTVAGLFRVNSDFRLSDPGQIPVGKPYLLFLHGTASSTEAAFGGLRGSELWKYIGQTYGADILAYQHRTLTQSPLQNAAELAALLPNNITLHIISHSRGGLIGDILSRYCNAQDDKKGFTAEEEDFLKNKSGAGGRPGDLAQIAILKKAFANKNLFIKKFIRVASPAAGTILASRRMDIYFNVIANVAGILTGGIANPLYKVFKDLISAIIHSKDDTDALPGIEAMNPASPFIKVLNNPSTQAAIDGPLAVISGNCGLGIHLKALKVITAKLFFLGKNDMVVNTDSMYLGTRRRGTIQFFFDESEDLDHFHYFRIPKTTAAIMSALKAGDNEKIPDFNPYIPSSSGAQVRALLERGELFPDNVTGQRAIVILLPGIMGSNIGPKGDPLWIDYEKFISGGLMGLADYKGLTATSIVKTSYNKLKQYLSTTYDVVTFPFDWRLPLLDAVELFNEKVIELLQHKQPIKIIGHSMGGVLVRDFMVVHRNDTWQRLKNSSGFQLLFLGAPLGGSFRIPSVLFGMDPIIGKLSLIDIHHNKEELLTMFSQMGGLLSLLPNNTEGIYDMGNYENWKKMRKAFGNEGWPLPSEKLIADFKAYRDLVQEKLSPDDYAQAVYIAGKAKSTPLGFVIEEDAGSQDLVFLSTAEGDQSVTWDSGIPSHMKAMRTAYYVDVTHGALANEPSIFGGISDILKQGFTDQLSRKKPEVRGDQRVFKTSAIHDFDLTREGVENTLLGLDETPPQIIEDQPLIEVSVTNGDLCYANYPVLAGHFEDDGVLYAEKTIDKMLGNLLTKKHRLGLYPGKIGTSELFRPDDNLFSGAIIAGLGKPGSLNAYQLTITVEQGISKFLLDINSNSFFSGKTGISALIIGCGYGGLSVHESAKAIIQGAQNANSKIRKLLGPNSDVLKVIEFTEKYEDRSQECLYALSRICKEDKKAFNVSLLSKKIQKGIGSARRMPHEVTEQWWNRITIRSLPPDPVPPGNDDDPNPVRAFQFSQSTGGAREDQRQLYTSKNILDQLIEDISTNNNWSAPLARTIFELVIPNDFKDQLKKQCSINWLVDKDTASYPWEMLQDIGSGAKPFSVNAGMIRQLVTEDSRLIINTVAKKTALIIAAPDLNGFAPDLPGAEKEGEVVQEILVKNGFGVTPSFKTRVADTIISLFKDDYKIIHLAGHGVFDEKNPANSGMVIGKNTFLTTKEIQQMSTTPELVFVNCCYLGKTSGTAERYYRGRFKLAANIGTQLIDNGVKAVVACGWAVNDAAALEFTRVFYERMFDGYNFGEAILQARKFVFENFPGTNTWGAYQCYGDPFYRLEINDDQREDKQIEYMIAQEAEYDLYNLLNELETDALTTRESLDKLRKITEAVDSASLRNAVITEKEALVYAELGDYGSAIARQESLLKMEKADFSFSCMERFCNIRGKKYVRDYLAKKGEPNTIGIDKVIADLTILISTGETAERYGLLGSAYKRKAILLQNKEKTEAFKMAAAYYQKAYTIPLATNKSYALANWLSIEFILVRAGDRKWEEDVRNGNIKYKLPPLNEARALVIAQKTSILQPREDYWSMVALTNLNLCLLILDDNHPGNIGDWKDLAAEYQDLWIKTGSRGKKLSEIEHLQFLQDALTGKTTAIEDTIDDLFAQLGNYLESVRQALEAGSDPKPGKVPAKKTASRRKAASRPAPAKGSRKK